MKTIQNIDEIWGRLKKACSNPKMVLSKRLSRLENVETIWRIKSPVLLAEGLTKIISTIKDLIQLSHRHNIAIELYSSGAVERHIKSLEMEE